MGVERWKIVELRKNYAKSNRNGLRIDKKLGSNTHLNGYDVFRFLNRILAVSFSRIRFRET